MTCARCGADEDEEMSMCCPACPLPRDYVECRTCGMSHHKNVISDYSRAGDSMRPAEPNESSK